MIKGDYDRLNDLAKNNVCAEHHTPLEVAWYGQEHTWVLLCDTCGYPDAITRQLSLTQEYKAGADIPEPIKSNIKKGIRRRQMSQNRPIEDRAISTLPSIDFATLEPLTLEQVNALLDFAYRYALDPFRSHVVLMYSKPYITLDGYLYHAKRSEQPFTLSSRPLTTQEEKQYKVGKLDHAWVATLHFTKTGTTFTGLGIVTYEEMTAKSSRDRTKLRSPVVAAHPWQLAQKRAEWQVMRRGFPVGQSPSPSDSPSLKEEEEKM